MKFILTAIILFFSACFGAYAQKTATAAPTKAEAELIQIERDIGQANIKRDKAYFERIEGDEFIFTDSAGGVTTKAEDVASLDKPAGDFQLVSYDIDDVKVNIYGNTAVVTGRTTTVSRGKGREITNRSRFTDVFVKRSGGWQIVAGHSSRIPPPQAPK